MDIVKKHLVNIVFAIIALVAIAGTFYPLSGYFEKLNKDVTERAGKYDTAQKLYNKPHELPVVKVGADSTAQPQPLVVFPMPKLRDMMDKYMNQLEKQSRDVFLTAVNLNKAECVVGEKQQLLLVVNSLPVPERNADNEFKRQIQPDVEYKYIRERILNGGYPPSNDEITKATDALKLKYQDKLIKGVDGQPINEAEVTAAFQAEADKLPEKMRTEAAQKARMYVAPDAMLPPADFSTARSPTPDQIWYAQAALWVQEDVCRALAECNKDSKGITSSPVKHLIKLDVPAGAAMYSRPAGSAGGGGDAGGGDSPQPTAAPDASGATGGPNNNPPPTPPTYTVSPTGRQCNQLYDVVNFTLIVRVDQTQIPVIINQLSRNRFITIKKVDLLRVDSDHAADGGFVYGKSPVAELIIDGEQLQLREWTIDFMPKSIKEQVLVGPGEYQKQLAPKKADQTAQAGQ
jgi:hypothetical protein